MRKEAREAIIEVLRDGYSGHYCDLHNGVFNTDYYIIGTYQAKKALQEYDVFEALKKSARIQENNLVKFIPICPIQRNLSTCCIIL